MILDFVNAQSRGKIFLQNGVAPEQVSRHTNGLTTPFVALVSADWQRFGNIKLFIKVRANWGQSILSLLVIFKMSADRTGTLEP